MDSGGDNDVWSDFTFISGLEFLRPKKYRANLWPSCDCICFMATFKSEHGGCYRGKLREKFAIKTKEYIDGNNAETFIDWWKDEFKILDYCRALHAEESAILSVARNGSSALKGATLYTSTYPCNLCANKIAQVGVKEVVYLEPYPMGEAKIILTNAGIKQTPFEGVTYNGYFKLFREEL